MTANRGNARRIEVRSRRRSSPLFRVAPALAIIGIVFGSLVPGASATATASPHTDAAAFRGEGELAFVSTGALYVLDGKDGRLTELSGQDSAASNPTFSPNGRWLLYETDNGATSWLARGDGMHTRPLASSASWLPDGQLWMGGETYVVSASCGLRPTGFTPAALLAGSASGTYVFLSNSMHVSPPKASKGVIRIETATSAHGPRTLWYEAHVSFTASGGLKGTFPGNVSVLPGRRGLLLTISSYCCDYADGQPIYELRSPLALPVLLGMVLTDATRPSLGPHDTFALGAGGDRYAWSNKHVELCNELTARCVAVVAAPGRLSLSPTWSPDGKELAFIDAEPEPEGAIGQAQIASWYATHHLYLLAKGATRAVEVPDTMGAAAPIWSSSSTSLLYVDNDALYLIAHRGASPVEVAGPLFAPGAWTAYYGEVDWNSQFAWSEAA